MSLQEIDAFLTHQGVKGMRWGVRKSRNEIDRLKPPEDREKPKVEQRAIDILRSKFAKVRYESIRKKQLDEKQKAALNDQIDDDDISEDESDETLEGGD